MVNPLASGHLYSWTDFFYARFKKVNWIKKFHHFKLISSKPGSVFVRERSDTAEFEIYLRHAPWHPHKDELPQIIPPSSLNLDHH